MTKRSIFLVVSIFAGAMFFAGCSNNATDEEMRQLANMRSEISSLQNQISEKQREKCDLQRQISDRDEKLRQCQADQDEAKKALGKQ